MALARDNVWLDLAGLPPKRLPAYYAGFDLAALAGKWIFGTDWPGVPGTARNVRALAGLGLSGEVLAAVLAGNAARVYPGVAAE
jgi:predicted TIM-barrel fold metal-dependent hydrolase